MNALFKAAAAAILAVGVSTPAWADSYVAEAYDCTMIDLNTSASMVNLYVQGDGDTDLDFYLYDPDGNLIFMDDDGTDFTFTTFETGLYRNEKVWRTFQLEVCNLGEVWNGFEVTFEAA